MKVNYRYQPMPIAHYIAANFLELFPTWTIYGGYAVSNDNQIIPFEQPVESKFKGENEGTYRYKDGSTIHHKRTEHFTNITARCENGIVVKRLILPR